MPSSPRTQSQREEAYRLAEDIDSELNSMSATLLETIGDLNASATRQLDPANPLTQIIKILNMHMRSLQWVESQSVELDSKIGNTGDEMRRRERERQQLFID
jgi:nuclear pore complex protein Nup62